MLKLFVRYIWNSGNRRVRARLFRALSKSRRTEYVCVDRGNERYVLNCRDRVISREVFLSGQFDLDKVLAAFRLLEQQRGPGKIDTLVDVGANIGTVCIPAVARGLARQAIAIEPDPGNCQLLRANVALNSLESKVVVHECAVGEQADDTLALEMSRDNSGDHRIAVSADDGAFGEAHRQRIQVASTRLDKLVQVPAPGSRMLIWMDTQGYEGLVLKGATALLAARVPLVSEFWPYGMQRAASYPAFRQCLSGYNGFIDLNDKQTSMRPIAEVDALYAALDRGTDSYTDILVV